MNDVKRAWGRSVALTLLALSLVITGLLAPVAHAYVLPTNMTAWFPDVTENNFGWAMKDVQKMGLKGIIVGNENGYFKPRDQVTQTEAIIMVVRAMGLEDEAKNAKQNSNIANPYTNVPAWAEGYVLVALQHGLIVPAENNFIWNQAATRAWAAQLLVRMLGKEEAAKQSMIGFAPFADALEIPAWAKGYVIEAEKMNLITGYKEGKGTYFRPNQTINRVEMTVMLGRTEQYVSIDPYQRTVYGKLVEMTSRYLVMEQDGVNQRFELINNASIYNNQGKRVTGLAAGDLVALITYQQDAYLVEKIDALPSTNKNNSKVEPVEKLSTYTGTVMEYYQDKGLLLIKDREESTFIHTFAVAKQVQVKDEQDRTKWLTNLQVNDEVKVDVNRQNEVVRVTILAKSQDRVTSGIVFDVNTKMQLLILEGENGTYDSYQWHPNVTIQYAGVRYPTMDQIRQGDEVKLEIEKGKIVEIEVVKPNQKRELTAQIVQVASKERVITLKEADGQFQAYPVATDLLIRIDGLSRASLDDLQANDQVDVQIDEGKIEVIKVKNRSIDEKLKVTIVSVDLTNEIVTVEDENGKLHAYELAKNIRLENERRNPELKDFEVGMKVELQLDKDQIIFMKYDNTVRATVEEVDSKGRFITVKEENGLLKKYTMLSNLDVNIQDVRRPDWDDIKDGDEVTLHLNTDEVVTEIDVSRDFLYEVYKVNNALDKIYVRDERKNKEEFRVSSSVKIEIPDVKKPALQDLRQHTLVRLTFHGYDLEKISAVPTVQGWVQTVNLASQEFTVLDQNGKLVRIDFDRKRSTIIIDDRKYDSLQHIAVGDVIVMKETLKEEQEIQVLDQVEGIYYHMNNDNIYLKKSGSIYDTYGLAQTVSFYEGKQPITPRALKEGQKIRLYLLEKTVYMVEVLP